MFKFFRRRGKDPTASAKYDIARDPRQLPPVAGRIELYETSAALAAAIDQIAGDCAVVEFNIFSSSERRDSEVENHPASRLLRNPNPYQTGFLFLLQTFAMLKLHGNAFWALSGDGTPAEIYNLRPDRVRIVPSSTSPVAKYLYEVAGHVVEFDPIEIVPFQWLSAASDWYGTPAANQILVEAASDVLMSKHNFSYFGAGNGIPAGIWSLPSSLSDMRFDQAKEQIFEMHSGKLSTAVVRASSENETVTFTPARLSPEDLLFTHIRSQIWDFVHERMGIPSGLRSKDSTEANARVAEGRYYANLHILHLLVESAITKFLLPFWDENLVGRFDDVRNNQFSMLVAKAAASKDILSTDERRQYVFDAPPLQENVQNQVQVQDEVKNGN